MDLPGMQSTEGELDPVTPHFTFDWLAPEGKTPMHEQIFALRFKVYCLECGFLRASDFEDGLESDEYDERSVHFIARDSQDELAGTVRLVHSSDSRFPFEDHCNVFDDVALPDPREAGEVSRLVVSPRYRRRAGDTMAGVSEQFFTSTVYGMAGDHPPGERRSSSPQILMRLYREMYQHSVRANIRYWYAAMEKSLARALSRLQFVFRPIGVETDYYGPVTPYLADLRELEKKLKDNRPELLAWFRKEPAPPRRK